MIDINKLRNKKIGLVLSGGGAKGAYQVGMFRALEELGLADGISAMSGCSIGAYAEVIFALKGTMAYRNFLHSFSALNGKGHILTPEEVQSAKDRVKLETVTKAEFCSDRSFWQFEARGLEDYFRSLLKCCPIDSCTIPLTVCCYSIENERPEYFRLQDLNAEERIHAILGSGSLPYLFSPKRIGSFHYLDGGVVPDICKTPAPADKIPLLPMVGENVDAIIINYLMPNDRVNTEIINKDIPIIEIRPRVPLEDRPGTGTSDFSEKSLIWREQLGYEDTIRIFTK